MPDIVIFILLIAVYFCVPIIFFRFILGYSHLETDPFTSYCLFCCGGGGSGGYFSWAQSSLVRANFAPF